MAKNGRKLYAVTVSGSEEIVKATTLLVSATNATRAERHVAQITLGIKSELASPAQVARLVGDGIKPIEAQEQPEPAPAGA